MGTSAISIVVCFVVWGAAPATNHLPEDSVDLIEINHFHDDQGRPVFDQIIFYDWSANEGRYQVRDWRLLKSPNQIPLHSTREREFVAVWNDFKAHDVLRATKAKVVRETWTRYDPELVEREFLPENRRKKLKNVKAKGSAAKASAPSSSERTHAESQPAPLRPLQNPRPM